MRGRAPAGDRSGTGGGTTASPTRDGDGARDRWTIAALLLGVRLLLFVLAQPWTPEAMTRHVLHEDAGAFDRLARTVLHDHRFATGPQDEPNVIRTPGYPLLVAAVYAVAGERPWVVLLVQIAIDLATGLLLHGLVARRAGRWPARLAATLYALDPFLALHSATTLLSDTALVFLLVAATACLARGLAEPEPARRAGAAAAAAAGALVGLGALTRPVAQYLPVVFLPALLLARRREPRRALLEALVFALAFAAVIAPWMARNRAVFGRLALSSSESYNLLVLNAAALEMARTGEPGEVVQARLLAGADSLARLEGRDPTRLNDLERGPYWRRVAAQRIGRDPAGFAAAYLRGTGHTFLNLGTSVFARAFGWPESPLELKRFTDPRALLAAFTRAKGPASLALALLLAAFLLWSYALTAAGVVLALRRRAWRRESAFLLLAAGYFVLVTGAAGLARFRLPAIPFYLPFAGLAWAALLERRAAPARRIRTGSR